MRVETFRNNLILNSFSLADAKMRKKVVGIEWGEQIMVDYF